MIDTLINVPRHMKLFGATLAMAALAAALLTVFFTAGPTQAQSEAYADPHPCGPGFDQFYPLPEFPVDSVDSGNYAIFDAYYDLDADDPHRPTEEGQPWAGLLSLNFCPPEVEEEVVLDDFGDPTGEIIRTRHESHIDIDTTVFHVDQQVQHTLTNEEVEAYDFFKLDEDDNDPATQDSAVGQTVYWLRVGDDPNTSTEEQASDLQFSFSTALFDDIHWYRTDGQGNSVAPFWYEIEAERELGIHPKEYGHFYVFDDSEPPSDDAKEAICNTRISDTCKIYMEPGDYRKLQWVFTKTGTYEIEVHLNAHVRQERPEHLPQGEKWHPASEETLVSSEVKKYTFYVGGDLTLNEEPMFWVERSVDEYAEGNSNIGNEVGGPIKVTQGDNDPLYFDLSGRGHSHFDVAADANGHAQITVADGAVLDYEVRSSYDLVLNVSDRKDRAGKPELYPSVDHTLAVRISIEDVTEPKGVTIRASENPIDTGETLQVWASVGDLPQGANFFKFVWYENNPAQNGDPAYTHTNESTVGSQDYTHDSAGTRMYRVVAEYSDAPVENDESNHLTVEWVHPGQGGN